MLVWSLFFLVSTKNLWTILDDVLLCILPLLSSIVPSTFILLTSLLKLDVNTILKVENIFSMQITTAIPFIKDKEDMHYDRHSVESESVEFQQLWTKTSNNSVSTRFWLSLPETQSINVITLNFQKPSYKAPPCQNISFIAGCSY